MIGNAFSHGRLFTSTKRGRINESGSITNTLKFGEASTPFKDLNRARGNSQLEGKRTEETSLETNVDRFMKSSMSSPYLSRATANSPVTMKRSSNHLNGSAQRPESTFFGTRMQPDKELMSRNFVNLVDPMDMSSSLKDNNNGLATESRNTSGGLRWRSDEASDEEDEPISSGSMPVKGRRRRFAAR